MTDALAIKFPRDVQPAAMEPLLLRLHGLLVPPNLIRPGSRAAIELVGDRAGARAQVWCSGEPLGRQLRGALGDAFRGGLVEPVAAELPTVDHLARVSLGSSRAPLRVDGAGAGLAGLIAPLGGLTGEQRAVVQFVLTAAPLRAQGRLLAAAGRTGSPRQAPVYPLGAGASGDRAQALRRKAATPLFRVSVTAAASSATLLASLLAGFRQLAGAEAFPRCHRVLWAARVRAQLAGRRHSVLPSPVTVGAGELAAALAPDAAALLAAHGPVLASRRIAPPSNVPRRGRVLAVSNAGPERTIALTAATARTHSALIGPTNCGKTTQLVRQGLAAVEDGCGFISVEPLKSGGTESFLRRLPDRFRDRVVVLDPERERDHPVAINFLERAPGQDAAGVAAGMLGVLRDLHLDLGQRTADVLYNAIFAVASTPGGALADLPRLLLDADARHRSLEHVADPFVRGFFEEFERRSEPDRLNVAAPAIGRLRPLLRPELAPIVGQSRSTIDFDRILAERGILLVRVPAGAELFGALIVDRIWRATLRRAALPEHKRPDTLLAIDEVASFLRTGADVAEMLAVARELRLAMALATQSVNLCPPALRQALLVNARSRITWQTDESEAAILGRGLGPELEPTDLIGLGEHEVAIRLAVGNATARPFTGRTLPLPDPLRDSTEQIRAHSRERYGRPRSEVEAELRKRLAPVKATIDPEAIGTRPR